MLTGYGISAEFCISSSASGNVFSGVVGAVGEVGDEGDAGPEASAAPSARRMVCFPVMGSRMLGFAFSARA